MWTTPWSCHYTYIEKVAKRCLKTQQRGDKGQEDYKSQISDFIALDITLTLAHYVGGNILKIVIGTIFRRIVRVWIIDIQSKKKKNNKTKQSN